MMSFLFYSDIDKNIDRLLLHLFPFLIQLPFFIVHQYTEDQNHQYKKFDSHKTIYILTQNC